MKLLKKEKKTKEEKIIKNKKENPNKIQAEKDENIVIISGIVYSSSFANVGGKLISNKEGYIQSVSDESRPAPYCIIDNDGNRIGWVSKESISDKKEQ